MRLVIIALLTYSLSALADLQPQLAKKGKLLLSEDFQQGHSDKWKFLHGTRFKVEEGKLVGIPSTEEYQQAHQGSHSGKTPSSRLYVMSQNVIMQFTFQMKDGLREVHIGANDGTFKTGSGHVGRVTFSTRSGLSLVKDRNVKLAGDKSEILATKPYKFENDKWYTVMVEFVGSTLAAQVEGGPSLIAQDKRFDSTKSDINLPTRGGGTVVYDKISVWQADLK